MRSLFWLLVVFAAAVALVIVGRIDSGYVLLIYPPYRVEISMLFFAIALVAGFALLYALIRLLGHALSLPAYVRGYRARRRRAVVAGHETDAQRHCRERQGRLQGQEAFRPQPLYEQLAGFREPAERVRSVDRQHAE